MAISSQIKAYLKANGSRGGKASWKGLTKAQRTERAKKAAKKRNGA